VRLALRLALAMMVVSVASLAVVVASQALVTRHEAQQLPEELRLRLVDIRRAQDAAPWPFTTPPRPPLESDPTQRASEGTTTVLWSAWAVGRVQDAHWRGIAWGLAIAALLSAALAWWMARGVAGPIEGVGRAAAALASGDLARRVEPPRSALGVSVEVHALTTDFNQMADALERAEGERTAMVADIAHELRTPLAALLLRLEALREGLTAFDDAERTRLHGLASLLHRLVEDLRTLSLADAGRLGLRRTDVDLTHVATETIEALAPLATAHAATLSLAGPATDASTTVDGDADRLAQVLGNLVDNAIGASRSGGWVEVRTFARPGEAGWVVSDDGPGIDEDDLPHVFQRFRQGDRGRRDLRRHSGLGLAIVRTLVEAHGGHVTARNRAEGGAALTVTLPTAQAMRSGPPVTPGATA